MIAFKIFELRADVVLKENTFILRPMNFTQ